MSKSVLAVIVVVCTLGYVAYISVLKTKKSIVETKAVNSFDFETIKPPVIEPLVAKFDGENDKKTGFSRTDRNNTIAEEKKHRKKVARHELIALYNNKVKYNYSSLDSMISKIQTIHSDKKNPSSTTVVADLERIRHNLKISQKIAAKTHQMIITKDNVKQIDPIVLDSIMELQKQLIITTTQIVRVKN